ncbi:MAG: hypothetical protein K0U37_05230 [Gammaproteobacteria bacterium]|nr:hypothetical protein [Gammaproteobacteria bacterium]
MQIQLEDRETHTIQAYSDTEIKVNDITYKTSFILSRDTLITPWAIQNAAKLNQTHLQPMLDLDPEIIILGTEQPDTLRRLNAVRQLCEKHIGIECMALGAASRTFNILLSEHRRVVAGFIFNM